MRVVRVEHMVDIFKKGKFNLFALTETKLKGEGEASWVKVNGIIFGVQVVERAREGVAVLLNDVWHSTVLNMGVLAQELYGLNSIFQGLKFMWWWGTAPMKERMKKEIGFGTTRTGLWFV